MNAIDYFLRFNAIILTLIGPVMYFRPKAVVSLWHRSPTAVEPETLTVMAGWGATIMALAAILILITRSQQFHSKKIASTGLVVGWTALAHGTYVMLNNQMGQWNDKLTVIQLVAQGILAALSAYFALLYKEPQHIHAE